MTVIKWTTATTNATKSKDTLTLFTLSLWMTEKNYTQWRIQKHIYKYPLTLLHGSPVFFDFYYMCDTLIMIMVMIMNTCVTIFKDYKYSYEYVACDYNHDNDDVDDDINDSIVGVVVVKCDKKAVILN